MRRLIQLSLYSLVSGVLISGLGAIGRFSAKADDLQAYSETLFQGAMIAIIGGVVLIFLACLFFVLALIRSEK